MPAPGADNRDHAFGRFRLASRAQYLAIDDALVPLGGRALDLLLHLVLAQGRVVSKDELLAAIWPGRIVEENNLTVQVSALRRVLAQGGGEGLVQTVAGRGYRFTAVPERAAPAALPVPAVPPSTSPMPVPATSFIGRAAELAALRALVPANRLVTISGIGGIGKTRLALRLVEEMAPHYPDGTVFVDMSVLGDRRAVPDAVAAGLGLGGAEPPMQRMAAFLRQRRALVVLDNCEHLVDAVAGLVPPLLAACPGVTLVVTSREALGIPGERLFRLLPLPAPPPDEPVTAAGAMAHDAVRLMVERAGEAVPGFALTDANAGAIAQICARLDGIALAIEMAASRLRVLSPAQLAERLHERFRLLAGPRGAVSRQRTLRAMLDWSWELLTPTERALLRRMSVFAGGAGLDGLMAVAAGEGEEEWQLLDQLAALVDKSLVVAETAGAAPRYRLLETTRQYAADRQAESGEAGLPRRHALHVAALYERAEAEWPEMPGDRWLEAYGADADNLRAALDWAMGAEGDPALGLRLVAASRALWWELPALPLREGHRWFDLAVARIAPDTPDRVAARLWLGQSWRDVRFGDRENHPAAARAIALFRASGDRLGLGAALWRAGSTLLTPETAAEARALFEEAERVLRAEPPGKWLALTLARRADLLLREGRGEEALQAYDEALRLSRATGHWYGLMNGGSNMAELLFERGEAARALEQLEGLRDGLSPGRRPPLVATLAAHLLVAGRAEEALSAIAEVVTTAPTVGMRAALAWAIEALALLRAGQGDLEGAARLAGHALANLPAVSTRAGGRRVVQRCLAERLEAGLAPHVRQELAAEGAAWTPEEAVGAARRTLADPAMQGPFAWAAGLMNPPSADARASSFSKI